MNKLKLLKAYTRAEELLKHQMGTQATHKHDGTPRDDTTVQFPGDPGYAANPEAPASQDDGGGDTEATLRQEAKEALAKLRNMNPDDIDDSEVEGVYRDSSGNIVGYPEGTFDPDAATTPTANVEAPADTAVGGDPWWSKPPYNEIFEDDPGYSEQDFIDNQMRIEVADQAAADAEAAKGAAANADLNETIDANNAANAALEAVDGDDPNPVDEVASADNNIDGEYIGADGQTYYRLGNQTFQRNESDTGWVDVASITTETANEAAAAPAGGGNAATGSDAAGSSAAGSGGKENLESDVAPTPTVVNPATGKQYRSDDTAITPIEDKQKGAMTQTSITGKEIRTDVVDEDFAGQKGDMVVYRFGSGDNDTLELPADLRADDPRRAAAERMAAQYDKYNTPVGAEAQAKFKTENPNYNMNLNNPNDPNSGLKTTSGTPPPRAVASNSIQNPAAHNTVTSTSVKYKPVNATNFTKPPVNTAHTVTAKQPANSSAAALSESMQASNNQKPWKAPESLSDTFYGLSLMMPQKLIKEHVKALEILKGLPIQKDTLRMETEYALAKEILDIV